MTNEQREAIEYLKESVLIYKNTIPKISQSIDTVLSLIKEQEKKIEKTDKIIDKISQNPFNELRVNGIRFCGGDIKQYFTNLVEKE